MNCVLTIAILPPRAEDSGAGLSVLTGTTANTSTFTSATLVGKTIQMVFLDVARISSGDYSFNSGSGTITWGFVATAGVQVQILYSAT